jgi:WD40 repeat protein
VASTTHKLRVRDPQSGETLPLSPRLVRSLPHPERTAYFSRVAFTPAGTLFGAGYPSGIVQVWDVATGKELRRVATPPGLRSSSGYALTPDNFSTLYVPTEGRTRTPIKDAPKETVRWDYQGEILRWDLATGKANPSIKAPERHGFGPSYLSPDGGWLVALEVVSHRSDEREPERVVRLYDTATGKGRKLGGGFAMAAFLPNNRGTFLTFGGRRNGDGGLKLFGMDGKEHATFDREAGRLFYWPTTSAGGKFVAAEARKAQRNGGSAIRVYDAASRKRVAEFVGDHAFLAPTFSPDGRFLAACDQGDTLSVWDVVQRTLVRRHTFKGMWLTRAVAFSPDGKKVAMPARAKTDDDRLGDLEPLDMPQPRVYLFDLTSKAEPEEIVCPHGWAAAAAFSADGKTLAVGGSGAVHLFDVGRAKP